MSGNDMGESQPKIAPTAAESGEPLLPPWTPFQKTGQVVRDLSGKLPDGIVWENSRFVVIVRDAGGGSENKLVWLSIKNVDNSARHDWRQFQRIKNELVGPEVEAVELYPAESRLVDNANQWHLWCVMGFRLPFGFEERLVSEGTEGVSQRPFEPDNRPPDLTGVILADIGQTLLLTDGSGLANRRGQFQLGRLVATRGALDALRQSGQDGSELLARHWQADWGEVDEADRRQNDAALHTGGRLLSAYLLPGGATVWIITEADRSRTTLLTPAEY